MDLVSINTEIENAMVTTAKDRLYEALADNSENGLLHGMKCKSLVSDIVSYFNNEKTKPPFKISKMSSAYVIASSLLTLGNDKMMLRDFMHDQQIGIMYNLGWDVELPQKDYDKIKRSIYKDIEKYHFRMLNMVYGVLETINITDEIVVDEINNTFCVTKRTLNCLNLALVKLVDYHETDVYYIEFAQTLKSYITLLETALKCGDGKMMLYPTTMRTTKNTLPSNRSMVNILFELYEYQSMHNYGLLDNIIVDKWYTTYISKLLNHLRVVDVIDGDLPQIQLNEEFLDGIEQFIEDRSIHHPKSTPLVIPPKEWGYDNNGKLSGGFHNIDAPLVPTLSKGHLNPEMKYLDGVNRIQNTGFRINRKLLNFAKIVGYLHEANSNKGFDYEYHDKKPRGWTKARWIKDCESKKAKNRDMSKIIDIAERYQDFANIFFTMYADFRSRLYYRQEYLSPQGQDISKGCLEFDIGYKVDADAVRWMQINIANLAGKDDKALKYRSRWTRTNEGKIRDMIENPLRTKKVKGKITYPNVEFMMSADKPWQFIAACIDYLGYLDDPENYESHLPVGLDGCCNGTQHWCAMLRDLEGGTKVALVSTEVPADLYTEVLNALIGILEGISDPEEAKLALAWLGTNKIKRKLVKTPTMTTTYAAGRKAFRKQVKDYCIDNGINFGDTMEEIRPFINYMVERIIESIDAVVDVKKGMDFVQDVVRGLERVYFKTPLGFHVYMENKLEFKKSFTVKMGKRIKQVTFTYPCDAPDRNGIVTGIAPNFVHSMDATHMIMTVLACGDRVTHWMMIHDQFSTHAANVQLMRDQIRQTFCTLYSEDQLDRFRKMVNPNIKLPEYGDWEPEMVLKSNYFFC